MDIAVYVFFRNVFAQRYLKPSFDMCVGNVAATDLEMAKPSEILASTTDSEAWNIEVERVAPKLKVTVRVDGRDWRSHLEQVSKDRKNGLRIPFSYRKVDFHYLLELCKENWESTLFQGCVSTVKVLVKEK